MVCLESDAGDGNQEGEPRREGDRKAEEGGCLRTPSGCQILETYEHRSHAEQCDRELPQQQYDGGEDPLGAIPVDAVVARDTDQVDGTGKEREKAESQD